MAAGSVLASASAGAERLPVTWWSVGDGLPRDAVLSVFVDSRDVPWVATLEGIARIEDGVVTHGVTEGLVENRAHDVTEDAAGTAWIATQAGVFRLRLDGALPGADGNDDTPWIRLGSLARDLPRWTPCLPEEEPRDVAALRLLATPQGTYCGTERGLYRIENGEPAPRLVPLWIPEGGGGAVRAIALDPSGLLWVGGDMGLVGIAPARHDGDAGANPVATRVDLSAATADEIVQAIAVDREGRCWVGTRLGLFAITGGVTQPTVTRAGFRGGLSFEDVRAVVPATDGTLWVGSRTGLAELPPGAPSFRRRGAADGLTDEPVLSLAEDRAGDLWVGTEVDGLARIARNGLSSFGLNEGLGHPRISALMEDRTGTLVAVDVTGTHAWFDGRGFHAVRPMIARGPRPQASTGRSGAAIQDSRGDWWLPTSRGLARWRGPGTVNDLGARPPDQWITSEDGLPANDVRLVHEDARGDLLVVVVTAGGPALVRWSRASGACVPVPPPPGLEPRAQPSVLRNGPLGSTWAGFDDGTLARLHDGTWTIVRDGRPFPDRVRDAAFDSSGRLWAAVESHGVLRIDSPQDAVPAISRTWTQREGLSSAAASCIVELRPGVMAIGTARGLDVLDVESGRFRRYREADGLPHSFVNVARVDRAGNLWLGTLQGLARLAPRPPRIAPPPQVRITAVSVDGVRLPVSLAGETRITGLVLRPGRRQLTVAATGRSVDPRDELRHAYSLDGSPWSDARADRTVTLAGLPAGSHSIQFVAVSSDGRRSTQPALLEVTVRRPTWRRPWFIALVLASLAGGAALAHGTRVRRLLELERVRTHIATDLHDDIGASLSQVAILSEVARRMAGQDSPAAAPLERIADVTRELVDSMSDIVWAIDPRRDTLGDAIHRMRRFASDLVEQRGVALRFEAPEALDHLQVGADVRRQVHLVFKEGLNNAVRHSSCSAVEIGLAASRDELVLRIADDGEGFEVGEATLGHGLTSMKRRAHVLGGHLDVDSAPGRGTRIRLTMPLRKKSKKRKKRKSP